MSRKPEWANNATLIRVYHDTVIKPFSCGEEDLDSFLTNDVYKHSKYMGLVTYVLENIDETLAYFSLENDRLFVSRVDDFWEENNNVDFRDMYGDANSFPSVKIARFAVNIKYQRRGIGKNLINYIIGTFLNNKNKTGCQFLVVDALETDDSRFFYDGLNFQYATAHDIGKPSRLRYLCLLGFVNSTND